MATSGNKVSSVLPDNYDLKLCFLGDDGVGKSSLIQSYITQKFPPDGTVPAVVDPQQLRRSVAPSLGDSSVPEALKSHNLTLIDTDGGALARIDGLTAKLQQVTPDVIVLCYAQGRPESLTRIAEYWLPALVASGARKPGWPYLPICLCGLKADEFSVDDIDQWRSVYGRVKAATKDAVARLSSGSADEIEFNRDPDESATAHDLWQAALTQLLLAYPSILAQGDVSAMDPAPNVGLMREVGDLLYMAMTLAMHPIFPIYNPHANEVTPGFAKACKRIFRILDRDGDGLLSQDEMCLNQEFTFGLRVTHGEMDDVLMGMRGAESLHSSAMPCVDPARGYLTFTGFQQIFVNSIMNGFAEMVWRTLHCFNYKLALTAAGVLDIQLTVPVVFTEYASLHESASLTFGDDPASSAEAFLTRIFRVNAAGPVLSSDNIQEIFSCVTGGQPFGRLFPDCTHHNNDGGISIQSWLNLWRMLLATDAPLALSALYELGYARHVRAPATLDFDPRQGVKSDSRRKSGKNVKSSVRRIFVLGSHGSGKSTLILHYILEGREGVNAHLARLEGEGEPIRPLPTLHPTHYVADVPPSRSTAVATPADAERQAALPQALVITEYPASMWNEALNVARTQCDAMLFTVDVGQAESIAFFREVVQMVPDNVPVAVVATSQGSRPEVLRAGFDALSKLCGTGEALDVPELKVVDPSLDASALTGLGLQLEVFQFRVGVKHERTAEVFRYLALIALDAKSNNPCTSERRKSAKWKQWLPLVAVGGVVLTVAVAAGAAYSYHAGTRLRIDNALAKAGLRGK